MDGMGLSYQYLRIFGLVIRRASTSTIRKSFLTIRLFFGGTGSRPRRAARSCQFESVKEMRDNLVTKPG